MTPLKKITTIAEAQSLSDSNQLIGVFEVPKEIYHKGPGISCSGLKNVMESPAYYQWALSNPKKKSRQMRLGDALHALLLEPDLFSTDVIVAGKSGNTKAHQDAKKEFPEANVITEEDMEIVQAAADFIKSKELARKILSGYHEYAFYWIDEQTGVLCKCRPDSLHRTAGIIGDLKFTGAEDEEMFMRISSDFKYHVQNAFYLDGVIEALKQSGQTIPDFKLPSLFFLVAVTSSEPISIIYGQFPAEYVEEGRKLYRKALKKYAECVAQNYWPTKNEVFNEEKNKWIEQVKMLKPQPWHYSKENN